MDMLFR